VGDGARAAVRLPGVVGSENFWVTNAAQDGLAARLGDARRAGVLHEAGRAEGRALCFAEVVRYAESDG
jgi:hypothetical protein